MAELKDGWRESVREDIARMVAHLAAQGADLAKALPNVEYSAFYFTELEAQYRKAIEGTTP